jgi:hypothetical protein
MMINRRQFVQGMGAVGAIGLTGMPSIGNAQAQAMVNGKPSRLLLIMMNGGYAPMMTSAASFRENTAAEMSFGFGGAAGKPFNRIGDITYDLESWGTLSAKALDRLGCIGTVGASNHNSAHHFWKSAEGGLAQALASKMGGNSAIKAARVGAVTGASDGTDVGGVALEPVSSLESALATLNGAGDIITKTQRPVLGNVVDRTLARFESSSFKNRENLGSILSGYKAYAASLKSPAAEVSATDLNSAYSGLYTGSTDEFGLSNKLKVAEGLLRSGVNVVCIGAGEGTYWDHHDDNTGARTRAAFASMVPGLNRFCDRMMGRDDMNLSIVFVSEHSRIPLISNHGPHLSTIVISDNVIAGASTGVTDRGGLIPDADTSKPIKAWQAAIGEMVGLTGAANPWGTAPQHRKLWKHMV